MEDLSVETINYGLSPKEQVCSCYGFEAHKMGEEVRKELLTSNFYCDNIRNYLTRYSAILHQA